MYCSDCDASGGAFPGNSAGSSSNSSLSTRSLDSPSTSLEQVHPGSSATATAAAAAASALNASPAWDSDVDVEPDPPDWSQGVPEQVLAQLSNSEKKRQEVINGEKKESLSLEQNLDPFYNSKTLLSFFKIRKNTEILNS